MLFLSSKYNIRSFEFLEASDDKMVLVKLILALAKSLKKTIFQALLLEFKVLIKKNNAIIKEFERFFSLFSRKSKW